MRERFGVQPGPNALLLLKTTNALLWTKLIPKVGVFSIQQRQKEKKKMLRLLEINLPLEQKSLQIQTAL